MADHLDSMVADCEAADLAKDAQGPLIEPCQIVGEDLVAGTWCCIRCGATESDPECEADQWPIV